MIKTGNRRQGRAEVKLSGMTPDTEQAITASSPDTPPATTTEHPAIPYDLYCLKCAYNLRGLTGDRCPECGESLGDARSPVSGIPWVHRRKLGWLNAYWRTVCLVMFRQRRFCAEMARPVSFRDSQSFRWMTVLHAYAPLLAFSVAMYIIEPGHFVTSPADLAFISAAANNPWPVAAMNACLLLFLVAATGIPSYFFHPRDVGVHLQNRAIALSYYASAPLAWTAIPTVIAIAAFSGDDDFLHLDILLPLAVCLYLTIPLVWCRDLYGLMRFVLPQQQSRAAAMVVTLPSCGHCSRAQSWDWRRSWCSI